MPSNWTELIFVAEIHDDWLARRSPDRRCLGPDRIRTVSVLGHPDDEDADEHRADRTERISARDRVASPGDDPTILVWRPRQRREVERQGGEEAEHYREGDWVAKDV